MISCGCALFNARVVARRSRRSPSMSSASPTRRSRTCVARIIGDAGRAEWPTDLAALDAAIDAPADQPAPRSTTSRCRTRSSTLLVDAGAPGGCRCLRRCVDRSTGSAVAPLSQLADQIENADPAYRAELRAWTSDDPRRADGVPAFAVPHVDAGARGRHPDPRLRHPRHGLAADPHPVEPRPVPAAARARTRTTRRRGYAPARRSNAMLLEIAQRGLRREPAAPRSIEVTRYQRAAARTNSA